MTEQTPFSRAEIELGTEDLKLAKKMKVGGKVRVVVYGTLKELHQSAGDPTTEGMQTGRLVIDASSIKLASNNEIAELFDDEFDA